MATSEPFKKATLLKMGFEYSTSNFAAMHGTRTKKNKVIRKKRFYTKDTYALTVKRNVNIIIENNFERLPDKTFLFSQVSLYVGGSVMALSNIKSINSLSEIITAIKTGSPDVWMKLTGGKIEISLWKI